jgi:hypothetical protein
MLSQRVGSVARRYCARQAHRRSRRIVARCPGIGRPRIARDNPAVHSGRQRREAERHQADLNGRLLVGSSTEKPEIERQTGERFGFFIAAPGLPASGGHPK